MDTKRFFLYAIVIASLALAGCGGNGGGGTAMMPDPDPDPPMPIMCDAPQVPNAAGTACVDPPPPPREAPPMALVHGIVTANDRDHSATNPAPYTHDERPGKESGADSVTVGVKTDGTFGDVTIGTNKLTMSTEDMAPSVGRFADGGVFSRTNMGVTDTVYAYETKAAPAAQAWDDYATAITASAATTGAAFTDNTPTNPADTNTQQRFTPLTFATDVSTISMRFASPRLPSSGTQLYSYLTDDAYDDLDEPGTTNIRGQKFAGTFAGIPGEYSCTGTCTIATNSQGRVATLSAGWTFTPDNLADGVQGHMVQGAVEDADYLTFGYWVQKDEDTNGDVTIGVSTFASGTALDATTYVAAMAALEGTADYEGKAVGKFVLKTLTPRGVGTITDGGTFTADANLKAYFGGNAVSFNDRFTISGTIDGFRNDDGDMIDSNWSVTLEKANFSEYDPPTTDTKATPVANFNGATSAGGPAGTWGGSFYGTPRNPDGTIDTPATDNTDAYPTSVAGEFDAHFTNGHALGAFGAKLD